MKLKLSAALVAGAFAGLAATSAQAGVLQASFKVFAAEIFGGASVTLTSPVASYNLSRPLSGTSLNPNNFTLTLALAGGTWVTAPNAQLCDTGCANPINGTLTGISTDGTTATYAFSVANGVTYPVNSTITFGNVTSGTVNNLNTTLSAPMNNACSPQQAQTNVTITMTNASGVEFDTNDPGAIKTATYFASNVALRADGTSSSAFTAPETSLIDVFQPSFSKLFTNPTDITNSTARINIGSVNLADRGSFFDANGSNFYSLGTGGAAPFGTGIVGLVDAANLTLTITGALENNGTNLGILALFRNTACTTPITATPTISYNATRDTTTIVYPTTNANAADFGFSGAVGSTAGQMYVCYIVSGNSIIPPTQFTLTGTQLTKTTGSNEINDPVCNSPLYNLRANGVQVDVRNWIHPAQATATGWTSVVRIINPSDTQTITVNGQTIDSNGTLGATGTIVTLPPRAAKYFTSAQLAALLTTGTLPAADGNNARLRLTANGPSLRVQNYVFNAANANFIEASSAQGDNGYSVPASSQNIDLPTANNK